MKSLSFWPFVDLAISARKSPSFERNIECRVDQLIIRETRGSRSFGKQEWSSGLAICRGADSAP